MIDAVVTGNRLEINPHLIASSRIAIFSNQCSSSLPRDWTRKKFQDFQFVFGQIQPLYRGSCYIQEQDSHLPWVDFGRGRGCMVLVCHGRDHIIRSNDLCMQGKACNITTHLCIGNELVW